MLPVASSTRELPPMPVAEKIILLAAASNSVKYHWLVESATLYAPGVEGNPFEAAIPLTRIRPCGVIAMPRAVEIADPPMSTEKTTAPCGFSLVTNDRASAPPAGAVPNALPPITGKFGFVVDPATYALPELSTAIAATWSLAALSR